MPVLSKSISVAVGDVDLRRRKMRRQVELELGRPPSPRRISRLWTRRGRVDCVTAVGSEDPLLGGIVKAIFDMGSRQPFVVWRAPEDGIGDGVPEVLGCNAYSMLEFDS